MDYYELNDRTGIEFTHEEYEDIECAYLETNEFKDVAAVVAFFKKHGKEEGLNRIAPLAMNGWKKRAKASEEIINARDVALIDSRRELKETIENYEDRLTRTTELGHMYADKYEETKAEVARLNNLLVAYRKMVDVTTLNLDDIVLALARQ